MSTNESSRKGQREIRPFRPFDESPPLHFYIIQFVSFAYLLYRFASRDYTVYGFFPHDTFEIYGWTEVLWPVPFRYILSGHFIYLFIPRPSPDTLFVLQIIVVSSCLLGIFGVKPRVFAITAFVFAVHITGFMQGADAPLDGGTIALCSMLVLALSPTRSFYSLTNGAPLTVRGANYQWPVFLLFLIVGGFYTAAGLNKIVDVGPQWPFTLHLERLVIFNLENSLFVSSRYANIDVMLMHSSYALSVFGGVVTMIGEIGFISILFLPRYRLFFVTSMISLHVLVFLMAGINFVGSSAILLLCLDYNSIARKLDVHYDPGVKLHRNIIAVMRRLDWFSRLQTHAAPATQATIDSMGIPIDTSMAAVDENDEMYYGVDAVEQACGRCPLLIPASMLMKFPGAILIGRYVYGALMQSRLGRVCDGA